ncbi:MAG: hypothetical protein EXR75_01985 [Myxococcales bacterium]|nr:hypothetical protein [Myxococcales bacterium]
MNKKALSLHGALFVLAAGVAAAVIGCEGAAQQLLPGEGGGPVACGGGCPAEQKCHFADGQCIYGGIANCGPCAEGAQCSPAFPEPTCVIGTCSAPTDFSATVLKLVSLAVAPRESGCDLDGDGNPNNSLASVLADVDLNAEIAIAVASDRASVLLEATDAGWGELGSPFDVSLWFGTLAQESAKCSPANPEAFCTYTVARASYDPATLKTTCETWLRFDGVQRTGEIVASPSPGSALDMVVPVTVGSWLLQLLGARFDATATASAGTDPPSGPALEGRLCAAVPKSDLLLAVDTLPADVLAKFGGRNFVRNVLDGALEADIDADGDGVGESVSAAMSWHAVPARIVGYSPTE